MPQEYEISYPLTIYRHGVKLCELTVRARTDKIPEVIKVISSHIVISTTTPIDKDTFIFHAFIRKDALNIIKDELKNIKGIEYDIRCSSLMDMGIGIARTFFPIHFLGRRGIVFSSIEFMKAVHDVRMFMGAAIDAVLYYLGFHYGYAVASAHLELYGLKEINLATLIRKPQLLKNLIEYFMDLAKASGWIKFELVGYNLLTRTAAFKGYDSWEAKAYLELYGKSNRPVCHITRGCIAGVISAVTKERAVCIEEKCIAKGDPYCYFRVERIK